MTDVKAGVEYKINLDGKSFLLNHSKYNLLNYINETGSLTEAAKLTKISYRTALNYIEKIESALDISIVDTQKGGRGGGGRTSLSQEGYSILKECKKINAVMELHREVNEIEATVLEVNKSEGIMKIKMKEIEINIPLNEKYEIGDAILALISYDNIFLMLNPQKSSIRNILKGKIIEMSLENEIIRVKMDVGGIILFSDITLSAEKSLNLSLGKEIYIGFKAMSVATLKI
jgi:molybdate transport system regulatory protein